MPLRKFICLHLVDLCLLGETEGRIEGAWESARQRTETGCEGVQPGGGGETEEMGAFPGRVETRGDVWTPAGCGSSNPSRLTQKPAQGSIQYPGHVKVKET